MAIEKYTVLKPLTNTAIIQTRMFVSLAVYLFATAPPYCPMPMLWLSKKGLGMYLDSDAPIGKSNQFKDFQLAAFNKVKEERSNVFLETHDDEYVAMYPDIASAKPCVSFHNEHLESPKADWKMDDVMGATTWTYPRKHLGAAEHLEVADDFNSSVRGGVSGIS